MSRGMVHSFDVIAATDDPPIVDSEGRWEPATTTQRVRGRLGYDQELLQDVTNPDTVDLVALVPVGTVLTAPTVVRVPPGYENVAAPGDYLVQTRQRLRLHLRLACVRLWEDS